MKPVSLSEFGVLKVCNMYNLEIGKAEVEANEEVSSIFSLEIFELDILSNM